MEAGAFMVAIEGVHPFFLGRPRRDNPSNQEILPNDYF